MYFEYIIRRGRGNRPLKLFKELISVEHLCFAQSKACIWLIYFMKNFLGGGFSFQKRHGRIDWKKLGMYLYDFLSKSIVIYLLL